jgi:tetratricopeptide (TPR) repeat protein
MTPTPRRGRGRWLPVCACVLLGASSLPAAPRQTPSPGPVRPGSRVLVMPFTTTVDPGVPGGPATALWIGEAAAILLGDRLEAAGYGALSRDDRVALSDRLRVPVASALTRGTMIRLGQLVGASDLVFGQIRLGAGLTVRIETIRIPDARSVAPVTEEGSLAELLSLFSKAGDRIGAAIGPPPGAPQPRPAIPQAAFESYVKGVVAAMPAAAQRLLESAMTLAPHDGRVLTALWRVYTDQGAHEKALAAASAVPAEAPESWQARFSAALSLIELRRFDGAERALTALGADRPSAAVSNALGIVALRRRPGAQNDAAAHFGRAAAARPSVVDYHFNLGYARALAHDFAGAIQALRDAVRRDTADADAHLVLSTVLAAGGKSSEAAREFELAKLLGPSVDPAPTSLPSAVPAGLERPQSDLDRPVLIALEASFERPLPGTEAPTTARYLQRSRTLAAASKDDEAAADLRRAIFLQPYEDEPHLALGRLYHRTGRVADAIDEYKIAIWCRETAAARVALGTAFLETGDREAARREATRAIALAPDSADARALLRKIDGGSPLAGVLTSRQSA